MTQDCQFVMSATTNVGRRPQLRALRHTPAQSHAHRSAAARASRLEGWLATPLDVAAALPRALIGSVLCAPEQLSKVQTSLDQISQVPPPPAPLHGALLSLLSVDLHLRRAGLCLRRVCPCAWCAQGQAMDVIERDLATFIERGASVEAAVMKQLRGVLPPEVAAQIPSTRAQSGDLPTAEVSAPPPTRAVAAQPAPTTAGVTAVAGNGAGLSTAEPGAMPTTDARAAAALAELQGAVQDVQVRSCRGWCAYMLRGRTRRAATRRLLFRQLPYLQCTNGPPLAASISSSTEVAYTRESVA